MDYSLPGYSVHGISQARRLEWVATSFSRGSSRPRDQTHVSCIAGWFFTTEPPGKCSLKLIIMVINAWRAASCVCVCVCVWIAQAYLTCVCMCVCGLLRRIWLWVPGSSVHGISQARTLRESIPRQIDKKFRVPKKEERGLGLWKWRLGVWNSQEGEKDKRFFPSAFLSLSQLHNSV